VTPARDGSGSVVRARFDVDALIAAVAPMGGRSPLHALVTLGPAGRSGSAPVRGPRLRFPLPIVSRRGGRLYAVTPRLDYTGHLMVTVVPVTARRVIAALRRRWSRGTSRR
jgi:poly(ribitol-phosphate) beta-N-acetylglucosaminyltransferase